MPCESIATPIDRNDFQGIYVAASPQPATNAQFMRELRAALHRPWSPPVPSLAVRLGGWLAGINADLALSGQRCAPRRLMEQGFAYEFPELSRAVRESDVFSLTFAPQSAKLDVQKPHFRRISACA